MYQVTKNHIERGRRNDTLHCPLALSISENLKWTVEVDYYSIKRYRAYPAERRWEEPVEWKMKTKSYDLSDRIQCWISEFDEENSDMDPFEFEIGSNFIKMKGEPYQK